MGVIFANIVCAICFFIVLKIYHLKLLNSKLPHFKHSNNCPACGIVNNNIATHIMRENGVSQCCDFRYWDKDTEKQYIRRGCGFKFVEIFENDLNEKNKDSLNRFIIKDIIE